MFNTHAVARALTVVDLTPIQADAVFRQAAEHDISGIAREMPATKRDLAARVRWRRQSSPHLHAARLGRQDPTGSGRMSVV